MSSVNIERKGNVSWNNFKENIPRDRCQAVNMVTEQKELELEAAEEMAVLLRYGSDISKEDFAKKNLLRMISKDTVYLVKVERFYNQKTRVYIGVIDKSYDCFKFVGKVNYGLNYSRMSPVYRGLDLEMVLDRMEQTKCRGDIGFKVIDLVKIN